MVLTGLAEVILATDYSVSPPGFGPNRNFNEAVSGILTLGAAGWIWLRLRSPSGPAAAGAPWSVVAYVLFGYGLATSGLAGNIVWMFGYPGLPSALFFVRIALHACGIFGAYFLEHRSSLGVWLSLAYWAEAVISDVSKIASLPVRSWMNVIPMGIFTLIACWICARLVLGKDVWRWVRGSDA